MPVHTVTLRLLGAVEAAAGEHPVPLIAAPKAKALIAYLLVERHRAHRRQALASLLWPDVAEGHALNNLRQMVFQLRRSNRWLFGDWLDVSAAELRFFPSASIRVDVIDFEAEAALPPRAENAPRIEAALEQYRGAFLSDISPPNCEALEEWLTLTRERYAQMALRAMAGLAAHYEIAGNAAGAARLAARQIALDPLHEAAHAQLMRAYLAMGCHTDAVAAFERARAILAAELGVAPSPELQALAARARTESADRALAPLDLPVAQLPVPMTAFVGRSTEIADVLALLTTPGVRLVTVTGLGGIGKTRLAIEVAHRSSGRTSPVVFVSLVAAQNADALVTATTAALGMLVTSADPLAQLTAALRDREVLLVLDNIEQVAGAAAVLRDVLQAAPRVQALVTSRVPLGVYGERVYRLAGLARPAVPEAAAHERQDQTDDSRDSDAVQLFLQSASHANPRFAITAGNAADVAGICERVGGMPLAIELAAAWVSAMTPAAIADELTRGTDLLDGGTSGADENRATIRAVFDWSWQRLKPTERDALAKLAVFQGGFTAEAAVEVASATPRMLATLVERSLLGFDRALGQRGRYDIHELVRQYCAERLKAGGAEAAARERHAAYYLHLARRESAVLARAGAANVLADVRRELDNARAAWALAVERADVELLAVGAPGLYQIFTSYGLGNEGEAAFECAIEAVSSAAASDQALQLLDSLRALRALLLNQIGRFTLGLQLAESVPEDAGSGALGMAALAEASLGRGLNLLRLGDYGRASQHLRVAWERASSAVDAAQRSAAPDWHVARLQQYAWQALHGQALVEWMQSDYAECRGTFRRAVSVARASGNAFGEMQSLSAMGYGLMEMGLLEEASAHCLAALPSFRAMGYPWGEEYTLMRLGWIESYLQKFDEACARFQAARRIAHDTGDRLGIGHLHVSMGMWWERIGAYDEALDEFEAARAALRALTSRKGEADSLRYLALTRYHRGEHESALALAMEGARISAHMGYRMAEHSSLTVQGHALAALQRVDEAEVAYRGAAAGFERSQLPNRAAEARAGLAELALARGDVPAALEQVREILRASASRSLAVADEPARAPWACVRVLRAAGDPRADALHEQLRADIRLAASNLANADNRARYLAIAIHQDIQRWTPP